MLVECASWYKVDISSVGSLPEKLSAHTTCITKNVFGNKIRCAVDALELQRVLGVWFCLSLVDFQQLVGCGQQKVGSYAVCVYSDCCLVYICRHAHLAHPVSRSLAGASALGIQKGSIWHIINGYAVAASVG